MSFTKNRKIMDEVHDHYLIHTQHSYCVRYSPWQQQGKAYRFWCPCESISKV